MARLMVRSALILLSTEELFPLSASPAAFSDVFFRAITQNSRQGPGTGAVAHYELITAPYSTAGPKCNKKHRPGRIESFDGLRMTVRGFTFACSILKTLNGPRVCPSARTQDKPRLNCSQRQQRASPGT
jgi:hypothetical protein